LSQGRQLSAESDNTGRHGGSTPCSGRNRSEAV
jgi:hypothetical protein